MVNNKVEFIYCLILLICIMLLCAIGCAPRIIPPIEVPVIEIETESIEEFKPEEKLEKPEKPNPIYLNTEFSKIRDIKQIKYFAFNKKEFPKILQLSKAFDAQEKIINSYEDIINLEIQVNNNLKNIINDRTLITQHYADLYVNEQNLRLQQEYKYEKDKFLDKMLLYLQSCVIVVLTILSK